MCGTTLRSDEETRSHLGACFIAHAQTTSESQNSPEEEQHAVGEGSKLVIYVNSDAKMSRGKYAAQAVHAALLAMGAHPGTPVVVLGARRSEIAKMRTVVHDAGRTEVEPGTLTAGTNWIEGAPRTGQPSSDHDVSMNAHVTASGFPFTNAQEKRRARLLAHIEYGPDYNRAVADNVSRADRSFDNDSIDRWLTHAEAHLRGVTTISHPVASTTGTTIEEITRLFSDSGDHDMEIRFRASRAISQGEDPETPVRLGGITLTLREIVEKAL